MLQKVQLQSAGQGMDDPSVPLCVAFGVRLT